MTPFGEILKAAGGVEALADRLPRPKSAADLRGIPDDRYLSLMSLRVFRTGIKHSVVDAKWPAFEEVFLGFDPGRVRAMNDEQLEALMGDTRIIRHGGKIRATRDNAAAMCTLADEAGGMGAYIADWPADDIVGLWTDITKRFKQMGGRSAPYFLRMAGRDTFILTSDVVLALNRWGAIDGEPKGKRGLQSAQEAFNAWANESGRPLSEISMVLALSRG
jgi:3-methyladenine DNA glycosylase Tag